MLICPYCEQDYVWKVRFIDLDLEASMCLECDTVWFGPNVVEYGKGSNFEDFMAERGKKADWTKIVQLNHLEKG